MTTATEYRQYAEECLVAMRAAVIPEVRAALCTAAQRWKTLADKLEDEEAPLPRLTIAAAAPTAPTTPRN